MAGKGVYVVLLGIIGILSLALAVLIIFISEAVHIPQKKYTPILSRVKTCKELRH